MVAAQLKHNSDANDKQSERSFGLWALGSWRSLRE
jgi:hypothetical protein